MEDEPAFGVAAAVDPHLGFVPHATTGTGLAGVVLGHQDHLHTETLGLVGEHLPHLATRHLVNALVAHAPAVFVDPACAKIAYRDGLDACSVQRRDKVGCLLVQRIAELM
jgi:hypothetical protein